MGLEGLGTSSVVLVTCGGTSGGPASGGPSARWVMGGGVRRAGPCSGVLVRVKVECVVTVIRVVSSAEDVVRVEVEVEVDESVRVQVSMLVDAVPLAAAAVVVVDALVDGGSDSALGSRVDVMVCVVGPQVSWLQPSVSVVMVVTLSVDEAEELVIVSVVEDVVSVDEVEVTSSVLADELVCLVMARVLSVGGKCVEVSVLVSVVVGSGAVTLPVMFHHPVLVQVMVVVREVVTVPLLQLAELVGTVQLSLVDLGTVMVKY